MGQGPEDWSWLDVLAGPLDDDFEAAVNEEPARQDRPALKTLFDLIDPET